MTSEVSCRATLVPRHQKDIPATRRTHTDTSTSVLISSEVVFNDGGTYIYLRPSLPCVWNYPRPPPYTHTLNMQCTATQEGRVSVAVAGEKMYVQVYTSVYVRMQGLEGREQPHIHIHWVTSIHIHTHIYLILCAYMYIQCTYI